MGPAEIKTNKKDAPAKINDIIIVKDAAVQTDDIGKFFYIFYLLFNKFLHCELVLYC